MAEEYRFHQIEKKGNIVIWKFSNPPLNLLALGAIEELVKLIKDFDKDPSLQVGVFTSAEPGMFIQHADLSEILDWSEQLSKSEGEELDKLLASMLPPMDWNVGLTSKPIICAINGPALSGGTEMALICDFRFIASDCYMGLPEINAGIIPGGGGTQRLARLLGEAKALEICMTGSRIPAEKAEEIGLVTQACDPEELMPIVMKFAGKLGKKPPKALRLIKRSINEGLEYSLTEGLSLERKLFYDALMGDESKTLLRQWLEAGQDANINPADLKK